MTTRHFLSLLDLSPAELQDVLAQAVELKKKQHNQEIYEPFRNKTLGMIFEKSSTRTRISFEAGMAQLGGHALFLAPDNTQLGRGEPIEDTARVLSSMVDIVMIRTDAHSKIETFAQYSSVPVINALTDDVHPCQLLADMQTYQEHRGSIQGKKVAWIGDGNNMCSSYINAAKQFDFELVVACPTGYEPDASLVSQNRDRVTVCNDIKVAARGADLVTTDVWASMGQEQEQQKRAADFAGFQVNEVLMELANSQALFMHCLPAHRGEEISEKMLDHAQSVVWDQAENRLHAQKALMEFLLK